MRNPLASFPRVMAVAGLLFGLTLARSAARADQTPAKPLPEQQRDRSAENDKQAPNAPAAADRKDKLANWPLRISYVNTGEATTIRLYDASGNIDKAAAEALDQLLCDVRDPARPRTTTLDRRTLQLLFRAAYHFRSREVIVISGFRKPGRQKEGRHGEGRAVDFRLPKVRASTLAAYLRTLPRVGVGLYTHRATQFVHLDSRDKSYHWLDPSPPGVTMPSRPLVTASLGARDASYAPTDDLPEAGVPEPTPETPSNEATPTVAAPTVTAQPEQRSNSALVVARILGVGSEAAPPAQAVADNAAR
jgi:uncharacterized protein YcbK (DUF882 family)